MVNRVKPQVNVPFLIKFFKLGTYKLYSIISDENLRNAKPSEDIFNFRKAKASEDIFSYERDCLLSSDKLNRLYLYIFAKMVHR